MSEKPTGDVLRADYYIVRRLAQALGGRVSVSQVQQAHHFPYSTAGRICSEMARKGLLEEFGPGVYRLPNGEKSKTGEAR